MQKRIEQILEVENLGVSQFADKIGVQRSGMSHILTGRNKPSLDFAMKVLQTFPDLSTDWLLFGKGAMYDKNADKSVRVNDDVSVSRNSGGISSGDLFDDIATVSEVPEQIIPQSPEVPQAPHTTEQLPLQPQINTALQSSNSAISKIIVFFENGYFKEFIP